MEALLPRCSNIVAPKALSWRSKTIRVIEFAPGLGSKKVWVI